MKDHRSLGFDSKDLKLPVLHAIYEELTDKDRLQAVSKRRIGVQRQAPRKGAREPPLCSQLAFSCCDH